MSEHAAFLPRYKHLRRAGLELNNRLARSLPRDVMDQGGKKLGMLKGNSLFLDTEDQISVFMDYCIYDVRRQGLNAVERYLAETPPAPDSDEMVLLQGMRQARFSLFAVEAVEPGVGVQVRDLLRDESLFIMDVGFSTTASPGLILACRFMAPEGIGMTTGAALPVGRLPPGDPMPFMRTLRAQFKAADFSKLSPEETSEVVGDFIRTLLRQGAAERIEYREPRRRWGHGRASAAPPPRAHIGRNEPCPCGSGKKFKHCCGARK